MTNDYKLENIVTENLVITKDVADVEKIHNENNGLTRVSFICKKRTPSEKFRKKITHSFDRKKVMVTKQGQTYNVYDKIQSYAHDSNFYKVLEDYNCTPDEAMERMKSNMQPIKGIFEFGKTYAEHLMQVNEAKEQFDRLPVTIKQKFGNSVKEFIEHGHEYIANLDKEINKTNITIGDVDNG
jgi:hypothetical protein